MAGPTGRAAPPGPAAGGGAPAPTVLARTGGGDGTGGTYTTGPGGTLPTDDQYTDSVGSLVRKVAHGRSDRRVEPVCSVGG